MRQRLWYATAGMVLGFSVFADGQDQYLSFALGILALVGIIWGWFDDA